MTPAPAARRALLSVSDKDGIVPFARRLAALGVEIVSTGGTAKALTEAGLAVIDVSVVTGVAEMLDGRVKTLHPAIHGGILADLSKEAHASALSFEGIAPIDLVVCNLYPFEDALDAGRDPLTLVETIDVGGPSMIRAAAKNFARVAVVVDPADYDSLASAMEEGEGAAPAPLRRRLAAKAFARLAAYDAAVASWLSRETEADDVPVDHTQWRAVGGRRTIAMRYGENPHQAAGFYRTAGAAGVGTARLVQGKALSYNNLADADAAWQAAADFADDGAVVIVKHANPCGIAVAGALCDAYERARACDPVSAFGGVVALTREMDRATAEALAAVFTEVVVAPSATDEALAVLGRKPAVRVLLTGAPPETSGPMVRTIGGGFLVQESDAGRFDEGAVSVVTQRVPTEAEWRDLRFAWRAVKHVKSNAIVLARGAVTVGIGAGQMSRVDAVRIAAAKAEEAGRTAGEEELRTHGAVAASDAFFPFADGVEEIARTGATAVIQPGGSRRDAEVIAAADAHGLAMVTTGMRHFRH